MCIRDRARARDLEAENARLKSRLAILTNAIGFAADEGLGNVHVANGSNRAIDGGEGEGFLDGAADALDIAADAFENPAVEEDAEAWQYISTHNR